MTEPDAITTPLPPIGIRIAPYPELFRWNSFTEWCNRARRDFIRAGVSGPQTLCVDARGRVCTRGKQFMQAKDDGAFPVIVYLIDP